MQKRPNSSALAMELHLFCIEPSKWKLPYHDVGYPHPTPTFSTCVVPLEGSVLHSSDSLTCKSAIYHGQYAKSMH